MFDQANTLRKLMADIRDEMRPSIRPLNGSGQGKVPRVIAVTGGKGGVGKTLTTANLGLCFARLGMRTLIIDGDFGLANLDVILNVRAESTIDDVLAGECHLKDVVLTGPEGVRIIPAASGVLKVHDLGQTQKLLLLDQIENLNEEFDFVLIDTPAGVSKNVQYWTASAAEVVIVVTPEPTSLADGYATMKILSQTNRETKFKLITNMVKSDEEGLRVYDRLSSLADEYLNVKVEYLGSIPFDEMVRNSIRERTPYVGKYPFCPASRSMRAIATHLLCEPQGESAKGTMQFFWRRMVTKSNDGLWS